MIDGSLAGCTNAGHAVRYDFPRHSLRERRRAEARKAENTINRARTQGETHLNDSMHNAIRSRWLSRLARIYLLNVTVTQTPLCFQCIRFTRLFVGSPVIRRGGTSPADLSRLSKMADDRWDSDETRETRKSGINLRFGSFGENVRLRVALLFRN